MTDTYKTSEDAHEAFKEYLQEAYNDVIVVEGKFYRIFGMIQRDKLVYDEAFNAWLKKQESENK